MKLPFRQFWQLRSIERRLRRSEPHMAAMLAMFAMLNAGEAIISREQAHPAGRVLAVLAGAIACLAAVTRWVSRQVKRAYAAACRRSSGTARSQLSTSSAADNPADPGPSLGL